ncbi:cleavage and polyadenylation specificity factor subunit 6-like isoform X2 [Lineus longissimus]|uniref:cleavage and polyadenylation specificity factor subunit 6-like isoform X2 n=1 Tax=Lineus longissimus TaxID=88925 RepID=UPI00315DD057
MADGVDIDIYENLEDFNQQEGEFNHHEGIDLYDDVITAPSGEGEPVATPKPAPTSQTQVPTGAWTGKRIALYVGNLTWWTTDQNLTDAISSLGVTDLVEIKFYENRANGQSKGFAVVTLGSDASYKTVMDRLPGKELHGQNPVVTQCNRNALNQFEQQSRKPDQQGPGKAFRDHDGGRGNGPSMGRGRGFVPRGPRPSVSPGPQGPPGPHNNHNHGPPQHHGPPPGHHGGPHGPPPPRPGPPPHHHQGPPPPRPGPPPPGHMGGPPPGMPPRGPPPGGPRGPPPGQDPRGPPPGPPRPDWDHRPPAPFHPGGPPPNHHHPGGPPPGHPGGPPPPRPGPPPQNPYPGPPPPRQPGPPGHPPHMGPPPQGPPPPHVVPPAPHVNPAFFPPASQPPPVQAPPPVQPDPYGRPPPVSYPSDPYAHRPPPESNSSHKSFPPSRSSSMSNGSSHTSLHDRDRDPLTPSVTEQEFEDMLEQNKTIMRSAIDKVVKDARQGKYASAIETLVTAISLIKQSKIANDDRCKICITSLQDTLHGVESKLYGSEVSSRDRRSRSWSRERERDRHDDREKRSRHRSRSREREKASTRSRDRSERSERYHEERSSRHRDGDRDRERDRERDSERYSTSSSSRRH